MICVADINPLLLSGFRGIERYSPAKLTRQFRWSELISTLNECINDSFEEIWPNQRGVIRSWIRWQKVRELNVLQATENTII